MLSLSIDHQDDMFPFIGKLILNSDYVRLFICLFQKDYNSLRLKESCLHTKWCCFHIPLLLNLFMNVLICLLYIELSILLLIFYI